MSPNLSQLRKFVSPEIIFGAGCRHHVANYARTFGARKALDKAFFVMIACAISHARCMSRTPSGSSCACTP